MFEVVGPWTWALFFSVITLILAVLFSVGGAVRQIIGLIVASTAFGVFVWIFFYRGYHVPGTDQPIGLLAGACLGVIMGLSMIAQSLDKDEAKPFKPNVPKLNAKTVASVGLLSVFVVVSGLFVYNAVDIKADNAGQGLNRFQNQFERQNDSSLRRLERFLAR